MERIDIEVHVKKDAAYMVFPDGSQVWAKTFEELKSCCEKCGYSISEADICDEMNDLSCNFNN